MEIKHKICLIPMTSWENNLRSYLTKSQWDKVRKKSYAEHNWHCQICNGQGGNGRKHPVECHEEWAFENGEVKLTGLMCLCPPCHEFHHPGLAEKNGHLDRAIRQFMKVNNISHKQAIEYLKQEFAVWRIRSQQDWVLNIDFLSEYMGKDFKFTPPPKKGDGFGDAF